MADMLDLDAYFERIRWGGGTRPDYDTLAGILLAHRSSMCAGNDSTMVFPLYSLPALRWIKRAAQLRLQHCRKIGSWRMRARTVAGNGLLKARERIPSERSSSVDDGGCIAVGLST